MQKFKEIVKRSFVYIWYKKLEHKISTKKEIQLNDLNRGPLVAQYLPKNGIGAELGVLKGNFSRILLKYTQAKELHLIDPWYFLDAHWSWAGGNTSTVDAVCKVLSENKEDINNRRVFVHIQDDIQVLKSFPDSYFDWVYIDSSHAYLHTVMELYVLKDKVKSNGVIGGDDWRPDPTHRHHGVYKAVVEFMVEYGYEMIYSSEENLQWFIKKKLK